MAIGAQAPSAPDPPISYVASVKPNNAVDARTLSEYLPGGRLTATAVTVGQLLRIAYRIQPYQLAGAPAWVSRALRYHCKRGRSSGAAAASAPAGAAQRPIQTCGSQ